MTLLFTHPACLNHETGYRHPESPERLRAVLEALEGEGFADLQWRSAPCAERAQIARAHDIKYLNFVFETVPDAAFYAECIEASFHELKAAALGEPKARALAAAR